MLCNFSLADDSRAQHTWTLGFSIRIITANFQTSRRTKTRYIRNTGLAWAEHLLLAFSGAKDSSPVVDPLKLYCRIYFSCSLGALVRPAYQWLRGHGNGPGTIVERCAALLQHCASSGTWRQEGPAQGFSCAVLIFIASNPFPSQN